MVTNAGRQTRPGRGGWIALIAAVAHLDAAARRHIVLGERRRREQHESTHSRGR